MLIWAAGARCKWRAHLHNRMLWQRLEPRTSQSLSKHSTTELPCHISTIPSHLLIKNIKVNQANAQVVAVQKSNASNRIKFKSLFNPLIFSHFNIFIYWNIKVSINEVAINPKYNELITFAQVSQNGWWSFIKSWACYFTVLWIAQSLEICSYCMQQQMILVLSSLAYLELFCFWNATSPLGEITFKPI